MKYYTIWVKLNTKYPRRKEPKFQTLYTMGRQKFYYQYIKTKFIYVVCW